MLLGLTVVLPVIRTSGSQSMVLHAVCLLLKGQHVDMNGVRSLDDSPLSVFSRGGDLLPILRQPKDGSLPGLPSTSGTPGTPGGAGSSTYKWQGIEAVLESYQRYREGRLSTGPLTIPLGADSLNRIISFQISVKQTNNKM